MTIVMLTGMDIETFVAWIASVRAADISQLRIAIDVDGVKVKADAGIWSPGLGDVVEH